MNPNLTQTSRAALLAAALAVPTFALSVPALAQTAPDATGQDTTTDAPAMDDTLTDDAIMDGTGADTDTDAEMTDPLAAPTGMDDGVDGGVDGGLDNGIDGGMDDATGAGAAPGTEGAAGTGLGDMDMDQLTYDRVIGDLRSGRDFSDQLDGMTDTDTVTIMGLSELEQTGGDPAAGAAMTTPGETAGDITAGTAPDLESAPGDAPAGTEAGMADGTAPAAGGAADPMDAAGNDIDAALEQADDSLTTMRENLADHEAVTQALEDEGYTADDVVALHRDDTGLTVVVDDRDN